MTDLKDVGQEARGIVTRLGTGQLESVDAESRRRRTQAEAAIRDQARLGEARWLAEHGVPRLFREMDFAIGLLPQEILNWSAALPAELEIPGGAILAGPIGAGKSAAAVWLIREVYRRGQVDLERGWIAAECQYLECSDLYRFAFDRWKGPLEFARRVALLVVDDVGAAHEASAMGPAELDSIVNRRWSERRATLLTTNLKRHDFQERYPRVWDRLTEVRGPGYVQIARGSLRGSAGDEPDAA